jgi:tetratricopeptide (TPR) repeat protein
MFFPKLRKRAKWVFVLLAAAFGIGFIGFGIGGTGGGGIADAIGDIFGTSGSALPSTSEAAENLAENPNDPEARQEYADALYADQQFEEAKAAYESFLELEPNNTTALRQLALLYQGDAAEALTRANQLQQNAVLSDPSALIVFDPSSTPFTQELARNDLESSVAVVLNDRALAVFDEAAVIAIPWVETLERLAAIEPNSPTIHLQIGQAAEVANDTDRAITAYLRALELDPAGAGAVQVRNQVVSLGGEVPEELNALIDENAANPAVDPVPGPSGSIGEQAPIDSIGDSGSDAPPVDGG